jgi:hypothetical protein
MQHTCVSEEVKSKVLLHHQSMTLGFALPVHLICMLVYILANNLLVSGVALHML